MRNIEIVKKKVKNIIVEHFLILLVGLMTLIIIGIVLYNSVPCVSPFFIKGCYIYNGEILWCCD